MTISTRIIATPRLAWRTAVLAGSAAWLAACAGSGPTEVAQASSHPQPGPQIAAADPAEVDSPLGSYLAGRLARHDTDMAAAARYFARALDDDPENVELLRETYQATHAGGRMGEAIKLARRLVEASPKEPVAGLTLASEAIRKNDFDAARRRLKSLSQKGYNALLVPLLTAWTAAGQERFEAALEALDKLKKRDSFSHFRTFHSALINDLAGNDASAETGYREALADQPGGSFRVVTAAGSFFERRGRPEVARGLYEGYQAENPDGAWFEPAIARLATEKVAERMVRHARDGAAEALFGVASTLQRENVPSAALMFARLAVYLRSGFDVGNLLLGEILESRSRPTDAIAVFRQIPRSSPLSWSVRQMIAADLDDLDRTEEAVAELRTMAAEREDRADASIALGDLLRSKERWIEAIAAYDEAIVRIGELEPRHWRPLYARGIAFERSKQWPRAERDFLRALDLSPDQPFLLNYLGYSWVDQGLHLERALGFIERAVDLRPVDGYIIDSLGWAMYRLGKFEDAVTHLERAVELRPDDPTINDHLGDAYWRVKRRSEARFQWRRALGLDPDEEGMIGRVQAKLRNGLELAAADGDS